MDNRLADILRNLPGQQRRPLLMAAGAKTPLLPREGHEDLVRTTGSLDTGESEVGFTAAEKLAGVRVLLVTNLQTVAAFFCAGKQLARGTLYGQSGTLKSRLFFV
ncbi:MAG: hypothetical protein CMJ81_12745 [Planctomycetaceae bacterium]|jgi:hypothetical protein|nr:hypothetical protein [Planctomycetaceae bacterium]MBP62227.1 hypothetical protein [Planctomycetaceae bacterium]